MHQRIRLALVGISLITGVGIKWVYRPEAYASDARDWGIADWGPSFLFGFGMPLLMAWLAHRFSDAEKTHIWAMVGGSIGAFLSEFADLGSVGTFSWADLMALAAGVSVAFWLELFRPAVAAAADTPPVSAQSRLE